MIIARRPLLALSTTRRPNLVPGAIAFFRNDMQGVYPTPRSGKGCLLAAFWKILPSIVKDCKIDIQHPALDDNCSGRLVDVDVTVTAPYFHFHLTSAK